MTVGELKAMLAHFPDSMAVFIHEEHSPEFKYNPLNSIALKNISFGKELDGKELAKDKVVVLETSI